LVYGALEEVREVPDGYVARLPNRPDMLALLAEDLNFERKCCPIPALRIRNRASRHSWTRGFATQGADQCC
jgi:hypothetical protein